MTETNARDVLSARIALLKEFITQTRQYMTALDTVLTGADPVGRNTAIANLNEIDRLQGSLSVDAAETLQTAAALYTTLQKIDALSKPIIEIVEDELHLRSLLHNMSQTYTFSIGKHRDGALDIYAAIRRSGIDADEIVFRCAMASATPQDAFALVIDADKLNKFIIWIIAQLVRMPSMKNYIDKLNAVVETQKDNVLGAGRIPGHLPPADTVCRYDLSPLTSFDSLAHVREKCGADAQIIVLPRLGKTPIEFNINGLIDAAYVAENDIMTTQTSGLTKRILKRFSTATLLKQPEEAVPAASTTDGVSAVCILEWYGGDLYRILGCRGTASYMTPIDDVKGLVRGLTTRPTAYSRHTAIMRDEHLENILRDYTEQKQGAISSADVTAGIMTKLRARFAQALAAKAGISTYNEFREIATNRKTLNEVIGGVLTQIGQHGRGSAEFTITHIARIEVIIAQFAREMEKQLDANKLGPLAIKERAPDEISRTLISLFDLIVDGCIKELDRADVWSNYTITPKEYVMDRKQAIVL